MFFHNPAFYHHTFRWSVHAVHVLQPSWETFKNAQNCKSCLRGQIFISQLKFRLFQRTQTCCSATSWRQVTLCGSVCIFDWGTKRLGYTQAAATLKQNVQLPTLRISQNALRCDNTISNSKTGHPLEFKPAVASTQWPVSNEDDHCGQLEKTLQSISTFGREPKRGR